MIKKEIQFKDIDGEDSVETAYFNLTDVELLRLSAKFGKKGDLGAGLKARVAAEDVDAMLEVIEGIILTAYGTRDVNGTNGFIKSTDLKNNFSNSIPYSNFVMSLLQNPTELQEFVDALMGGLTKDFKAPAANTTVTPIK